jgi:hypothetical protein
MAKRKGRGQGRQRRQKGIPKKQKAEDSGAWGQTLVNSVLSAFNHNEM